MCEALRWPASSLPSSLRASLHRSGYIRFLSFRFYAEEGLARKPRAGQHLYQYPQNRLSGYGVGWSHTTGWAEDNTHITEVKNARLIETGYQSPQFCVVDTRAGWMVARISKLPDYAARNKRQGKSEILQLPLAFRWDQCYRWAFRMCVIGEE